jgi:hypothetical protein
MQGLQHFMKAADAVAAQCATDRLAGDLVNGVFARGRAWPPYLRG